MPRNESQTMTDPLTLHPLPHFSQVKEKKALHNVMDFTQSVTWEKKLQNSLANLGPMMERISQGKSEKSNIMSAGSMVKAKH